MVQRYLVFIAFTLYLVACNRTGDIQVRNASSRMVIENIYWGDVYIGGNIRPGQETMQVEVERNEEKLPASHRFNFSLEGEEGDYQTLNEYELDRKGQLVFVLTDTTLIAPIFPD